MRFNKRLCSIAISVLLLLGYSCSPNQPDFALADDEVVAYRISPIYTGDTTYHLKIEGLFKGNASGETELMLPSSWGGKRELYQAVKHISVLSEGVSSKLKADSIFHLTHNPDQTIHFEYELEPLFQGNAISRNNSYYPLMQKDYFHFIGTTAFVYPSLTISESRTKVSLDWEGFPKKWVIHNSFDSGKRSQRVEADNGRWTQSVFVGGDFRVHPFEIKQQQAALAIRGKWNFSDSVLVEKLKRIITIQRDFWNDHSDDYYSVTLIPLTDTSQCCSYMGTGLTHSFATFAHDFEGVDQGFEYLFSHELMHHWIGTAIQNDEPEELKYWFSEGFTDYFTQLILLECGFVDFDGFVSNINKMLMDHYASPVREASNQEIKTRFWNDQEFEKLPYRRGAIFALYLDGAIKLQSENKHQLKNVMEELLHVCKKDKLLLSDSLFLSTTQKYLTQDLQEFMRSHVEQGQLIRLTSRSLGPNFTLTYQPVQQFDLGFDFEQSRENKMVNGVALNSRAYQAGLRDGQQLIGYSVAFGDVSKPVELKVISDEGSRDIKYWPLQDKPELGQVPQFVYNPRTPETAP